MNCDLHTHTNHSDGSISTNELVRLAKKKNLIVALTDHNTVSGLPSFLAEAERQGVTAVGGTELTTEYSGREFHLIGLFIDPEHYDDVEYLCQSFLHKKELCNRDLVDKLRALGYDIDYDEIKKRNLKGNANRAHIAAELVEKGYLPTIHDAFANLLEESCGLYKPCGRLQLCYAIEFLRSIHAVPILAHPLKDINPDELREMLPELISHGLVAIETMHSSYSDETIELSKEIARDFNLLESGGSDFHGYVKPGVAIGVGRGNLNICEEYYHALMARK